MGWLKSLKNKLLIARQLSLRDWLALAEAWWVLLSFYLALHWASYERLETSQRLIPSKAAESAKALEVARRLQRLVELAARLHLFFMTCLVRAFALRRMLHRRGIPATLRLGAYKSLAEIQAHAWVDVEGQAIGEAEEVTDRFKVLSSK